MTWVDRIRRRADGTRPRPWRWWWAVWLAVGLCVELYAVGVRRAEGDTLTEAWSSAVAWCLDHSTPAGTVLAGVITAGTGLGLAWAIVHLTTGVI